MELINILNIVKKWIWLIVLIIGATLATLVYSSSRNGELYESTAIIQVLTPDREDVSITDAYLFTSDRDEITVVINNFLKVSKHSEIYKMTDQGLDNLVDYEVSTRAELGADLLYVTASANSPESAAEIANSFAENAIAYYGSLRSQAAQQSFEHFSMELEDAENELTNARQELVDFQTEHGIASPATELQLIQDSLQRLNQAKDQQSIDAIFANDPDQQTTATAENQLAALQIDIQEANLEILKLENEIQGLEASEENNSSARRAEYEEEIKLYELRISLLEDQESQLSGLIAQGGSISDVGNDEIDLLIENQKNQLINMIQLEIEFNSLVENVDQVEEKINFLSQKANESNLMQAFAKQATFLQLIEFAEPSNEPESNLFILLILGFIGSLGFSLFAVFVLDFFVSKRSESRLLKPVSPELNIEK